MNLGVLIMAFYLSKSRILMNHLKPRTGSFRKFYWSSLIASLSHNQTSQSAKLKNPDSVISKRPSQLTFWRSESVKADKVLDSTQPADGPEVLNFPGGKVKFTSKFDFLPESHEERIQCYRVLNDNGHLISSNFVKVTEEFAVRMYTDMVMLQTMDNIFYEAQRQGRISFYVMTIGEEAINVASAAALHMEDPVFPQYREPGVLLWRGFTLQEFANQCFGNKNDGGKGRQMPAHYGSHKHNYFTVASTFSNSPCCWCCLFPQDG